MIVAVDLDRLRRDAELRERFNQISLQRWRKLQLGIWSQPRFEECELVLNGKALDSFVGKLAPFLFRRVLGGKQPPGAEADQCDHNDDDGQAFA